MESDSLARWKWVNALNGTALLIVELEVVLAEEFVPELADPLLGASAFKGALSTPEDGVYITEVVVAFDPADEDPDAEKEVEAPGPEVPEEALAWIYSRCNVFGSV